MVQTVPGIPTVTAGTDIAALLVPYLANLRWPDGQVGISGDDIVVVASKIVAKAEGRLKAAKDREALIDAESVRDVARKENSDGSVMRIVELRNGLVLAAAGIDSSNVPTGTVLLLPEDPDESARKIRRGLAARLGGVRPGVVITDTVGRPWRRGIADIAIGAAGIQVLHDLRGQEDTHGRSLATTVIAAADEIAAAADLVKGKTRGRPVAVVRGLGHLSTHEDGPGAVSAIRSADEDLFRYGTGAADQATQG